MDSIEDEDLVQTLRNWAEIVDLSQGKAVVVMISGDVFAEAADEVERLRLLCSKWKAAAEAYELGALGHGDRLLDEARRG